MFLLQHTTKDKTTADFIKDMLDWLCGELHGPALTLLIRTLHMEGNNVLRSALAQSLLCLSLRASHIRSAFILDGGLDAMVNMFLGSSEEAVSAGTDFFVTVEPLAAVISNSKSINFPEVYIHRY